MIQYIHIQNFRSVRDIELELGPLNIVFGPNGCGKSNIYNAIHLLTAAADGEAVGVYQRRGRPGKYDVVRRSFPLDRHPRRLQIACRTESFDYELQVGFPEKLPYPTQFMLDPIVKEEHIWLAGYSRRPSSRVLQRKNQAAFLVDVTGEKSTFTESIYENESVFGQLGEPHRFPEVSRVRETLRRWRFYHEFAIGRHSPLRQPAVGYRSPVLDSDGHNLAAAFQTIVEIGAEEMLHEILADAFPGCQFYCENEHSRFALKMRREGIRRPLLAAEMSDGTLRFLCLAVALLSPRPPAFLAINEPENSLHRDMLPALARLIIEASRYSQIWLTSHSAELAELIAAGAPCQRYALENSGGETRIVA
ncbi:AAA family ATPase [Klebsiella quasipneumoniae]